LAQDLEACYPIFTTIRAHGRETSRRKSTQITHVVDVSIEMDQGLREIAAVVEQLGQLPLQRN